MLEKTVRVNRLFDFYRNLLTSRQQKIFEFYYQGDLSLGEIAESENCSRQAVHDLLKRAVGKLEKLESELKFLDQKRHRQVELKQILSLLEEEELELARKKLKQHLEAL